MPANPRRLAACLAISASALLLTACPEKSKLTYCGGTYADKCTADQVCVANYCRDKLCPDVACRSTQVCVDGKCAAQDCVGVTCKAGEICTGGTCMPPTCGSTNCVSGQVCGGTACVDPGCLTCVSPGVCANGTCALKDCTTAKCGDGEVCVEEKCVDALCIDASCPAGKSCSKGKCVTCTSGDPGCTSGGCGTGPACSSTQTCVSGTCREKTCPAEACRSGEVCDGSHCVQASCLGVSCPGGQHCVDGACQSDTCGDLTCGARQACRQGLCVDALCATTSNCSPGQTCVGGACYWPDCGDVDCPTGLVCVNGSCGEAACAGATCPAGKYCTGGSCAACPAGSTSCGCDQVTCNYGQLCLQGACRSQSCAGAACRSGQYCVDDACVDPGCVGVQCPDGKICVQGSCQSAECGTETCTDGQACQVDTCVEPSCLYATCAAGEICTGGICLPKDCPTMKCPSGQGCYEGRCTDLGCVGASCPGGTVCKAGACAQCAASEANCSDGVDDDCDGLIDCADSDCNSKTCSDGNACTTGDKCSSGLCKATGVKTCDAPPGDCSYAAGSCDALSGSCKYAPRTSGAPCGGTAPACKANRCDGKGACAAVALPDDSSCGAGMSCQAGACSSNATKVCTIGGVPYHAGDANPVNACQQCSPSLSTTAWSPKAAGASCGTGRVCDSGTCRDGCAIGGGFYASGAPQPGNPCRVCTPAQSTTDWTLAAAGACGAGRVCSAGTCTAACTIAGTTWPAFTRNPANPCQACLPETSTSAWTSAPEGDYCAPGRVCSGSACKDGCVIEGGFLAPGTLQPGNECAQCYPALSVEQWSYVGSTCSAGICIGGACKAGCTIDGLGYVQDDVNPDNVCQVCEPKASASAWTNAVAKACGDNKTCKNGTCVAGQGCVIDGEKVAEGAVGNDPCQVCDSAQSSSEWSARTDGTSCGSRKTCMGGVCLDGCTIDGQFYGANTRNPDNVCQSCDPSRSLTAWSGCAKGTVCYQDLCKAGCLIDDVFYQPETIRDGNTCVYCDTNLDNYHWSNRVEGWDCDPAGRHGCSKRHLCEVGCGIKTGVGDNRAFWYPNQYNPKNPCQVCKQDLTYTEWTQMPEGTTCEQYPSPWLLYGTCHQNWCQNGCFIGGGYKSNATTAPGNVCGMCTPTSSSSSVTGWSPHGGTTCGDKQVCSTTTTVCCEKDKTDC